MTDTGRVKLSFRIVLALSFMAFAACATSRPAPLVAPTPAVVTPPVVVSAQTPSPLNTVSSFEDGEDAAVPAQDAAVVAAVDAAAPEPPAATDGVVTPADGHGRRFRGRDEDELLHEMQTRAVVRVVERFSSSTVVFHLDLGDGIEIAFKPELRRDGRWWRHEIAGYRLARVLGIEGRVPPAISRRVPASVFTHEQLRDSRLVVRGGFVEGAAIVWMPVLRRSNLETAEARARWVPWLDPANAIPTEHRGEAEQLATLIVFDYLQANFDRWNTGNIRLDERGSIVYRDNNRAWYIQNLRLLDRGGINHSVRLPAALLANVEHATGAVLQTEVLRDGGGGHHPGGLAREHYAAYETRRRHVVTLVQSLVARFGHDAVMPW